MQIRISIKSMQTEAPSLDTLGFLDLAEFKLDRR